MTWEYLHLISHSFPIVLFVTGVAVGIAGWLAGREELEEWALLAFLVGGAFVVPAYLTGLAAADVVADRTFVRPGEIQRHRTWATFASVPVVAAAILAGFAFAERKDRRLRRFVILVGAAAAGLVGFAASLGARIQHGEEGRRGPDPEVTRSAAPIPEPAPGTRTSTRIHTDERHPAEPDSRPTWRSTPSAGPRPDEEAELRDPTASASARAGGLAGAPPLPPRRGRSSGPRDG